MHLLVLHIIPISLYSVFWVQLVCIIFSSKLYWLDFTVWYQQFILNGSLWWNFTIQLQISAIKLFKKWQEFISLKWIKAKTACHRDQQTGETSAFIELVRKFIPGIHTHSLSHAHTHTHSHTPAPGLGNRLQQWTHLCFGSGPEAPLSPLKTEMPTGKCLSSLSYRGSQPSKHPQRLSTTASWDIY